MFICVHAAPSKYTFSIGRSLASQITMAPSSNLEDFSIQEIKSLGGTLGKTRFRVPPELLIGSCHFGPPTGQNRKYTTAIRNCTYKGRLHLNPQAGQCVKNTYVQTY